MNSNIKKRFEEVCQILCRCEQIKSDIKSLYGQNGVSYRKEFPEGSFLHRIQLYFFQIFVIQLLMLLAKKEDHNLKKLAKDLLADPETVWKRGDSKDLVKNAIDKLEELETTHLDSFKTPRDKFWVHRDEARESYEFVLSHNTAWEVLAKLQNVYNILNLEALFSTMRFDTLSDRDPLEVVHLSRYGRIHQHLNGQWAHPKDETAAAVMEILLGRDLRKR